MTRKQRIAAALLVCAAVLAGPVVGYLFAGPDGIAIAMALTAMVFLALLIGNSLFGVLR